MPGPHTLDRTSKPPYRGEMPRFTKAIRRLRAMSEARTAGYLALKNKQGFHAPGSENPRKNSR